MVGNGWLQRRTGIRRGTTLSPSGLLLLGFVGLFTLAACSSPTAEATSAPSAAAGGAQSPAVSVATERPAQTPATSAAAEPAQTPATSADAVDSSVAPDQSVSALGVYLGVDFEVEVYTAEDIVGGQDIHFSDIFGIGKPVVLNYWAGLCPPCRAEMPDLQKFNDEFGDKVTLFGLDIGPFVGLGSSEDGKALLDELGVTYPTGTTQDPAVLRENPPLGMPTTLFMTPDGTVVKRWTGLLTKDKLAELAEELLEASAG